jgi:hypothetical protein
VRECCEARWSDLSMSLDASCSTLDFQAIGGRVGRASSGVAIVRNGKDVVDEFCFARIPCYSREIMGSKGDRHGFTFLMALTSDIYWG